MTTCHTLITVISIVFLVTKTSARILQTTFAGGNAQDGNMFDLCAISTALQIISFDVSCETAGTASINIYAATNSNQQYNAIKSSSSSWTLIHQQTIVCASSSSPTILDSFNIVSPITITNCRGFYVTRTDTYNLDYTNGASLGSVYSSDTYLQFLEGIGKEYPFGAEFTPRIFNGRIHYNLFTPNPTSTPTSFTINPTSITTAPTSFTINPTSTTTAPTTADPTKTPSIAPTKIPTMTPSKSPSAWPTKTPTIITLKPSMTPTHIPTNAPTGTPTQSPTLPRGGAVHEETTKSLKATENEFKQNNSSGGTNLTTILIVILIIILICIVCVAIVIYWRQKKIKQVVAKEGVLEGISNGTQEKLPAVESYASDNMINGNVINIQMQHDTDAGDNVIGHVSLLNKYMHNNKVDVKNKKDAHVVNDINQMNYEANQTAGLNNEVLPPVIPNVAVTDMGPVQQQYDNSSDSQEQQKDFGETVINEKQGNVDDSAIPGAQN
eukprot:205155_1